MMLAYPLIADIRRALTDVGFAPKSDHLLYRRKMMLCANTNQSAAQQNKPYSTTVSARASKDGGTLIPSTFAVLRLIASSYLVGACTGSSAGFSPLRMRSA